VQRLPRLRGAILWLRLWRLRLRLRLPGVDRPGLDLGLLAEHERHVLCNNCLISHEIAARFLVTPSPNPLAGRAATGGGGDAPRGRGRQLAALESVLHTYSVRTLPSRSVASEEQAGALTHPY
jgi:hypothetical protein